MKVLSFNSAVAFFIALHFFGCQSKETEKEEISFNKFIDTIEFSNKKAQEFYNNGNAYKKSHNLTKAKIYYLRSIALEPKHSTTRLNLGNTYWQLKNYDSAMYFYRSILEYDSSYYPSYTNLSAIAYEMENYQDAAIFGKDAIRYSKNDEQFAKSYIAVSAAYAMMDSCDKANEYFRLYEKHLPASSENFNQEFKDYLIQICNYKN